MDTKKTSDLFKKIEENFETMSKSQKQIAQYIFDNYDKSVFKTAANMGQAAAVSEATVVRFAYFLGYDGYPALQKALQEMVRNKLTNVQRMNLSSEIDQNEVLNTVLKADMNNIRVTIDMVDNDTFQEITQKIAKARCVYVIGMRSSTPLAQFLGYYLTFILKDVKIINCGAISSFEQMINIDSQDVCIGISFPRYCSQTIDALKFANEMGAYSVAITDSLVSPLAHCAKQSLVARSDMASFADSLVAPLSVINALIVALSLQNSAETIKRFDRLETILNSQQIYHEPE